MSKWCCAFGVLLALWLTLTTGCQSGDRKMPAMHPVVGKVSYKSGEPLTGGAVKFQSATDTTLSTTGEIQPDGSFTLSTFANKERVKGAPPGEYRVTVIPPLGTEHAIQPITLPKPFTVEARDNTFTITLDKPAPKK